MINIAVLIGNKYDDDEDDDICICPILYWNLAQIFSLSDFVHSNDSFAYLLTYLLTLYRAQLTSQGDVKT